MIVDGKYFPRNNRNISSKKCSYCYIHTLGFNASLQNLMDEVFLLIAKISSKKPQTLKLVENPCSGTLKKILHSSHPHLIIFLTKPQSPPISQNSAKFPSLASVTSPTHFLLYCCQPSFDLHNQSAQVVEAPSAFLSQ